MERDRPPPPQRDRRTRSRWRLQRPRLQLLPERVVRCHYPLGDTTTADRRRTGPAAPIGSPHVCVNPPPLGEDGTRGRHLRCASRTRRDARTKLMPAASTLCSATPRQDGIDLVHLHESAPLGRVVLTEGRPDVGPLDWPRSGPIRSRVVWPTSLHRPTGIQVAAPPVRRSLVG